MSGSIAGKRHQLDDGRLLFFSWMGSGDIDGAVDIASRARSFSGPLRREVLRRALARSDTFAIVAKFVDTCEPAGFLVYRLDGNGKSIRIQMLVIDPHFQRKKIGSFLLSQMINLARSPARRRDIHVTVAEENLPGLLFLKSNGFRAADTIRNAYLSGDLEARDAYRMVWSEKVLSG